MRSLAFKLTLAFLLIGIIGVAVFALLLGQRTQREFERFLSDRDQAVLMEALGEYYERNEGWKNVNEALSNQPPFSFYRQGIVLANNAGNVLIGNGDYPMGSALPQDKITEARMLREHDEIAGYVLFIPIRDTRSAPAIDPEFLQRILSAAAISAGITVLISLVLGAILARTLTRPLSELTAATKAMAGGQLNQQVTVRSKDEIGQLAGSFNQMSSDLTRNIQSRKQMTADLAHDLRTPISILRGYTEGLKEGRLEGDPQLYDVMHGEVEHLQHLVEDLRMLSLADAGELTLNKRPVDPRALLERTGLAYFVQAEQRGIALRVDAPENLPSINVDTGRMTQVLNNLVSNALRHTRQGEVVLSASSENNTVQLRVSDTGSGIAPEHLPHVFDRFYRADPSRQRSGASDGDSTGLGLAIAKAIVEAHGGTISVTSTVAKGTTMIVALPIDKPHPISSS
jgi:two-component system sensor histidine kinase BaeS